MCKKNGLYHQQGMQRKREARANSGKEKKNYSFCKRLPLRESECRANPSYGRKSLDVQFRGRAT